MRRKHWPRKSGLGLGLGVGGGGIGYLLNDTFTTDRAAGAVNGTAAEPGPGTRTVVDGAGAGTAAISSGTLVIVGENGQFDPGYWLESVARVTGKIVLCKQKLSDNTASPYNLTLDTNQLAGIPSANAWQSANGLFARMSGATLNVGPKVTNNTYGYYSLIIKANGCYFLHKSDQFPYWTLFYVSQSTDYSTDPFYPSISIYTTGATLTTDFIRIPTLLWTPKPIFADSFTGTWPTSNGGGLTGLEAGGIGKTWQVGPAVSTWSISGGTLVNAATAGGELITNGNMETGDPPSNWTAATCSLDQVADERTGGSGSNSIKVARSGSNGFAATQTVVATPHTWHRISQWNKLVDATYDYTPEVKNLADTAYLVSGNALQHYAWFNAKACFRTSDAGFIVRLRTYSTGADGVYCLFDDVTVKPLTTNTLFTGYSDAVTDDVYIKAKLTTVATGFQGGVFLNMDSLSNPQNFDLIYLNMNDGKIYWDSVVAGVYTNKKVTSAGLTGGSELHVRRIGTTLYVWYNNAYLFTDTSSQPANTNYIHGVFSTGSIAAEVAIDDVYIYPSGSEGEYSLLDMFIN